MSTKLSALSAGGAIADADLFYSAQSGTSVKQPASAIRTYINARQRLTAQLDLYIDPAGDDNNNTGLTVGSPWQTIQKAFDYAANTIDMAGQIIMINAADGTYAPASLYGPIPGGYLNVGLNCPGAVTVSGSGFSLLYAYFAALAIGGGGTITFTNSTAAAAAIYADAASYIFCGNSTLQFTAGATDTDHMFAALAGVIVLDSGVNTSITGNFNSHMRVNQGGILQRAGTLTTFNGGPTVGTAFAMAGSNGNMTLLATQSSAGALTGKKYSAIMNGTIETFGQTLPGTVAGTTATGGQYA